MKPIHILSLLILSLTACQRSPQVVYQQPITDPGLTIRGPHEFSPATITQADSTERPSGGIYLNNSDHSAEMTGNIVRQMPANTANSR